MAELERVLIATDGSERAAIAVELASKIRWPADTAVEVLAVNELPLQGGPLPAPNADVLDHELRGQIDADLALARSQLIAAAPMTTTATVRGRAATEIVLEAERTEAHLIIIGSRGRGPIATMLLGSVAAEVVDRATCPVLVARVPKVERLVVADDGSATAALALRAMCFWPIFKGLRARVVSVAPVHAYTGVGPVRHLTASPSYAEEVDARRLVHESIARDGAGELTHAGIAAEPELRCGDPAEEIIGAAIDSDADLIVMGSRGQSGLERLVLGSVARKVLTHAPMSVLIVHRLR